MFGIDYGTDVDVNNVPIPKLRQARLMSTAQKGDSTVVVKDDLHWETGDLVGFAPTATQSSHFETGWIKSYDTSANDGKGQLTVATDSSAGTAPLNFYHFGAENEFWSGYTDYDWPDPETKKDMRGEVVLLSRNIKIMADQVANKWNGQFVTLDKVLKDSDDYDQLYQGLTVLHNVEFAYMGQKNRDVAAVTFINSKLLSNAPVLSELKGVTIHDGAGWGISIEDSQYITIKDVIIFNVTQIGVNLNKTDFVSLDTVYVYGVNPRDFIVPALYDPNTLTPVEGCFLICPYTDHKCNKTTVENSIAAGCPYAGFIGPGTLCRALNADEYTPMKNNIAHSVKGSGFIIFPDPAIEDQKTCYRARKLFAYKCEEAGFATMSEAEKFELEYVGSVDNTLGISLNVAGDFKKMHWTEMTDVNIVGEVTSLALDCPDFNKPTADLTGANCYCKDKIGHMSSQAVLKAKTPTNPFIYHRPIYKVNSDSTWYNR